LASLFLPADIAEQDVIQSANAHHLTFLKAD
jgi:hypothetical protein